MDLSTQTTELFNEMLFAGSVIASIVVNDPSYIQQKGKWLSIWISCKLLCFSSRIISFSLYLRFILVCVSEIFRAVNTSIVLCKGQLTLTAWVILLLLLKRCPADNCFKNSILYYYYKQDDDDDYLQPCKGLSSAWFPESWEKKVLAIQRKTGFEHSIWCCSQAWLCLPSTCKSKLLLRTFLLPLQNFQKVAGINKE